MQKTKSPDHDEQIERLKETLNGSLYKKNKWQWNLFPNQIPWVTIQAECGKCKDIRSFRQQYQWQNPKLPEQGKFVWGFSFSGHFKCSDCDEEMHSYMIHFQLKDAEQVVYKVGQYPSKRPAVPKGIKEFGEEVTEFFTKGQICEQFGYGIASSVYYRRIVEVSINRLIDVIIDVANEDGETTICEALNEAKEVTAFSDKLKNISDHLPASLSRNEANPIGALFSLLSDGVHQMNDDEALRWSTDARELLIFVIAELKNRVESSRKVKEVIARIKSR